MDLPLRKITFVAYSKKFTILLHKLKNRRVCHHEESNCE